MSNFQTIIYEKKESIGYITLNRPQVLNVYNIQMRDELYEVLGAIRDDPDVRVIIFQGAGERAFCAGADLSEFLTAPSPVIAREVRWERDIWGRFLNMPQPLIAALHGYVIGSGIEIALCCDLRVATEDVRFRVPETALGIIPAAGATQTLPRIAGRAKSLEALLTSQWIDAREAYRVGMVHRIVSRTELLPTAEKMAKTMTSRPPAVVRALKEAIRSGANMTLPEGLDLERRLCALVFNTLSTGKREGESDV